MELKLFYKLSKLPEFWRCAGILAKQYSKSRSWILKDMLHCRLVYGTNIFDYASYAFPAQLAHEQRDTYLSSTRLVKLEILLNNRNTPPKDEMYRIFKDFYHRDCLILKDASFEECQRFFEKHPVFFGKKVISYGGKDVHRIVVADYPSARALYDELIKLRVGLIEEAIIQHPDLEALSPNAVNTLRLTTLRAADGEIIFAPTVLRMGSGDSYVDNITGGGMYIRIQDEGEHAGEIRDRRAATDFVWEPGGRRFYEQHPKSGKPFYGFKFPYFEEAKELVRQASKLDPDGYLRGWDVAITKDGPCMVEMNCTPGVDMCENPEYVPVGMIPLTEKVLGVQFDGIHVRRAESRQTR